MFGVAIMACCGIVKLWRFFHPDTPEKTEQELKLEAEEKRIAEGKALGYLDAEGKPMFDADKVNRVDKNGKEIPKEWLDENPDPNAEEAEATPDAAALANFYEDHYKNYMSKVHDHEA